MVLCAFCCKARFRRPIFNLFFGKADELNVWYLVTAHGRLPILTVIRVSGKWRLAVGKVGKSRSNHFMAHFDGCIHHCTSTCTPEFANSVQVEFTSLQNDIDKNHSKDDQSMEETQTDVSFLGLGSV